MPIFSLPGEYGIGCFSKTARDFVDFLERAHQKYWQILPLGPTGYGDSPYQTFSTFAGNPYFISLRELIDEGLLESGECQHLDRDCDPLCADYARIYRERPAVLKKAFERWNEKKDPAYETFERENEWWLSEYALFMSLKDEFSGVSFTQWDDPVRLRDKKALDTYSKKLAQEIRFHKFVQYKFYEQWDSLRQYANKKGIGIIGDIPIYVSPDSSDLWAHPELFRLDKSGELSAVAGCPPDGFTPDGQLWGNPLYDWKYHESTGFEWWIKRMEHCARLYDVVRIDHFRGFDEYYSIPFGDKNARGGHWEKGPGYKLFKAIKDALGDIHVIAEDLGFITPTVRELVKKTGFPNMKVLEFAFDWNDSKWKNEYLPHNYDSNCVVYTGTHDNETLKGWVQGLDEGMKKRIAFYVNVNAWWDADAIVAGLIRASLSSCASYCIIPLQDYLAMGNEARINRPSTLGGNWICRCRACDLTDELADRIAALTDTFGRCQ
jgi:4-alpha-glucanotransferase